MEYDLITLHQLSRRSWTATIGVWMGFSFVGDATAKGTTGNAAYFNALLKAKKLHKKESKR